MSVSTNGPVPAGISGPLHGVADLERRPRRRKPRRSGGPAGRGWLAGLTPYLFIAVAVGLLVLLTYVPAINMIWYSLNDWNFRVILSRIERDLPRTGGQDLPAWSIQYHPSPLEQALWARRQVNIYDLPISDFVARLRAATGIGG